MQETWVWSLGQEDRQEEEMATHSSIAAWRTPRTEEPRRATVHGVAQSQTQLHSWAHAKESGYKSLLDSEEWLKLMVTLSSDSASPRLSSTSIPISVTWIKPHRGSKLIHRMERLELRPGRAWTRVGECEMPGPERLLWWKPRASQPGLVSAGVRLPAPAFRWNLTPGVPRARGQCLSIFFFFWGASA